ncbi:MAG: GNAT family N-acetyltransferase [Saccharospirillaceae bacterium]|nr:GNAT family N-acetyltransferase [Pseudomonadales bacterium]NRB79336.1 GNAT family N-acetyltransferase [Saccharospirillaceae bacterium]
MIITPITTQHLNNISGLYVNVFKAPPWNENWEQQWALERLTNIFHCPNFKGFIIEQDSVIIGSIMGRGTTFQGKKEFEICELFIVPTKQGLGFGSALYDHLLAELNIQGYKIITLLTSRKVPALDFYTNKSFKKSDDIVFMFKQVG